MADRGPSRGRLWLAAVLAAGLTIAVAAVVVLGGGEEERQFARAPERCIELWNDDPAAVAFGQHQSGSHGYYDVEVMELSPDGSVEAGTAEPNARCAVVFASSALDPEPVSAAQIHKDAAWIPLSRLAEFDRLAELQSEAQSGYNATIGPEGRIESL